MLYNPRELTIPIADEQIAHLEARRAGAEPRFTLRLWGTAQHVTTGIELAVSATFYPPFTVAHEQWLRVRKGCGFGERRLIELPAAPPPVGGAWDSAAARLAAAAARLAAGEPSVAIGEVRVALERIADAVGARVSIARENASGKKMPFANYIDAIANELTKRHADQSDDSFAVLGALFKATFGFSSEPGHMGFDGSAWNDAVLALGLATDLYSYLVRFSIAKSAGAADAANS